MAMLYSEPSHGKTTLLLHLLGLVQKAGGLAALSPIEGSYQVEWAKRLGVDTENLILVELGFRPLVKTVRGKEKIIGYEPEGLETLFAKYELLLDAKQEEMPDAPMLIGWDSITATPTKAELEGEYEEQDKAMALQARALSKGLRKLHQRLMASNTTLISIVQTRTKIGGFSFKAPTGGQALPFTTRSRSNSTRRRSGPR
jgi:recombination protein RecA